MGLSVAFDLPTQIGYDSDHALADGEVGKVGVAIDSLEDMEKLFAGIKLEDVSTSMTINASGFILLAFYVALAKKQGADLAKISGTIQNDILKEYAARGTYIYPPKASMRIITDIFEWCSAVVPKWNTISISGYHIREAGSTAAQEIAFAEMNGGDEDDGGLLEARMLPDHLGQFKAVQLRHADIHQDDRDVGFQQERQCILGRGHRDQPLAQLRQHHLIAQQLGGLVVHQKHIDGLFAFHISGAATS